MPEIGIVMSKYIINDILKMFRYYPVGLGTGIILFLLFTWMNRRSDQQAKDDKGEYKTSKEHEARINVWSQSFFWAYFMIVLMITLISRDIESNGVPDLTLFSTLHINTRNNAYLVENILLFFPYGFFATWNRRGVQKWYTNILQSFLTGFITSFWIEIAQLLTKRGCFQVDDIWSNALGSFLGAIVFVIIFGRKSKKESCV